MACGCLQTAPIVKYQIVVSNAIVEYTTEVIYVDLDTASQMMWATTAQHQAQPQQEGFAAASSWFAFMQVVHATPQDDSLQHYIAVLVFAKAIQDQHASAVMVVERRHVLYDQTVDHVIFALQVSNAGFKMTTHNKVLVGACINGRFVTESPLYHNRRRNKEKTHAFIIDFGFISSVYLHFCANFMQQIVENRHDQRC